VGFMNNSGLISEQDKPEAYCYIGRAQMAKALMSAESRNYDSAIESIKEANKNIKKAIKDNSNECLYSELERTESIYHLVTQMKMIDLCKRNAAPPFNFFIGFVSKGGAYSFRHGDYNSIEGIYQECNNNDKLNCYPHTCIPVDITACVKFIVTDGTREYYGNGYSLKAASDAFNSCFSSNRSNLNRCRYQQMIFKNGLSCGY